MTFKTTNAFELAADAIRHREVFPLDQRFSPSILLPDTILTAGSTDYKYINMNGYRSLGIQGIMTINTDSITATVEASIQDDGTAPASCTYQDKTNDWFGSSTWVDSNFLATVSNIAVTWVRVKYVVGSTGGSDSLLTLYAKRLY